MLHLMRREIRSLPGLIASLHGAVRLELATLPPYLTALYSIKPGANLQTAAILRSVAIEEMLHLCIVCNILNAIGERPAITSPRFPPRYPGPLPMGVGTEPGKPFIVPIKKASIELIRDIFMTIEEPEDPLKLTTDEHPEYHTIGQFYLDIEQAIRKEGNRIFTGNGKLQVTGWFPSGELFAVTDVESASRAIMLIIEQGEGTKKAPVNPEGKYAHYYRFSEIVMGRRLEKNEKAPLGYSYSGIPIKFDPDGVFPMVDNPSQVKLRPDSVVAQYARQFDETYSALLNAIQITVTGDPKHLDAVIGLMYTLRVIAQQLMSTPLSSRSRHTAGPRWRFLPASASA